MKFPNLETMIMYGIYSIRDLVLYSQNKLVKRKVEILNECDHCSFVFSGNVCNNCNYIKNNSPV